MNGDYEEALEQISQMVLSTMLQIETVRGDVATDAADVVASIGIHGGCNGELQLEFSPGLAKAAAAAMFHLDPAHVIDEDVRDMATELANMIGGNLKSLLPGPSKLSLPEIIAGRRAAPTTPTAKVALTTDYGPLTAAFYER